MKVNIQLTQPSQPFRCLFCLQPAATCMDLHCLPSLLSAPPPFSKLSATRHWVWASQRHRFALCAAGLPARLTARLCVPQVETLCCRCRCDSAMTVSSHAVRADLTAYPPAVCTAHCTSGARGRTWQLRCHLHFACGGSTKFNIFVPGRAHFVFGEWDWHVDAWPLSGG